MNILDKAIKFATEAHRGMFRKGTKIPYIVHPLEAAAIAATMTTDQEVIAAAVLHDVIEDTPVTEGQLILEFGARIAHLVCADSENKRSDRPAAETWIIRKQETLNHLKIAGVAEQIVVLADKLSNIRSICRDLEDYGDALWKKFNMKDKSKQGWYYKGIANRLDKVRHTHAYVEYNNLLEKIFDNCEITDVTSQTKECYEVKRDNVEFAKTEKNNVVKTDGEFIDFLLDGKPKNKTVKLNHYSWNEESPYRYYEKEYVNQKIEDAIQIIVENEFFRRETEYSKKTLCKLIKTVRYDNDLPSCSEWENVAEFESIALFELVKIVKNIVYASLVDALKEVQKKLREAKLFENKKDIQIYERLQYELTECSIKEFEALKIEISSRI